MRARRKRIAARCDRSVVSTDAAAAGAVNRYVMTLWMLTIVIFAAIWAVGTILITCGAVWLTRHEPH